MTTNHVKMICDIGELNSLLMHSSDLDMFLNRTAEMVSEHMRTEVCSIYLYDKQTKELTLKATVGLNKTLINNVTLKLGEGLVGTALQKLTPIKEDDGKNNPHFKYIPDLREDAFESIIAVPILQGHIRIGVLTVQRSKIHPFNAQDLLALKATASQLAGMISNAKALMSCNISITTPNNKKVSPEWNEFILLKGKIASEGFALSTAIVVNRDSNYLLDEQYEFNRSYSVDDFMLALQKTEEQLNELQEKVEEKLSDAASLIFSAHILMLKDTSFINSIKTLITEQHLNAPNAVIQVFNKYKAIFTQSKERIIQEKVEDIQDLVKRIINNIVSNDSEIEKYHGHIIVTEDLLPSELLKLSAEFVSGIILISGGVSSHISILARSLQIPLIICNDRNLLTMPSCTKVLLDAEIGNIYVNPTKEIISKFDERNKARLLHLQNEELLYKKAETADGFAIKLLANINLLSDLNNIHDDAIDGIGLYRTEFPFLIRKDFPSEEEQFTIYQKLFDKFPNKPVTMRTLDIGGDKVLSYYDTAKEQNPFLGMRSIRFSLTHIQIFRDQIRAILRAGVKATDLKIMFPMIASLDDFLTCKSIIFDCIKELAKENIPHNHHPKIGVMIELPSAVLVIDEIAQVADFLSIGTNDLVQYTLGVDRTNEKVAHLYLPHHPAILKSLQCISDAGKKHNIDVSICGDIAGDIQYIPFLLGIGITQLSVGSTYIPKVKNILQKITITECRHIAKTLLSKKHITDIETVLESIKKELSHVKKEKEPRKL